MSRATSSRGLSAPGAALLVIVGVACTLASARSAEAQLRGLEVKQVTFEGNETFPADSLRRAIATRATECRSWALSPLCWVNVDFAQSRSTLRDGDLPRDRARLILWYRQRGFRDVVVDTAEVERGEEEATVHFSLVEGRPVIADSIVFSGLEGIDVEGVLDELPIEEGDRLSTLTLDATRDSVVNRLANRGYAYVDVFRNALRPAEDPYNALVTFEVVPGPLASYGEISVAGVENLSEATVRRTVQLSPGDIYRQEEIQGAAVRLYGLDIVRSASVVPDTLQERRDSVIDINITVQEGDAYRVRAGAGWSTSECMALEARWTSRNFFGGGRRLQVRGRVGNLFAKQYRDILCPQSGSDQYAELTGLASVDFVQPWIFSTRNSFTSSVFTERTTLPDVFVRRAVGLQVGLTRAISTTTALTLFYRPELSQVDADNVLYCTGFLVCSPEDIEILEGSNWLAPVGVSLVRDGSDDLLDPTRGYRVFMDFEHAASWTGSDFRYNRVVAEASRYDPVGRAVLASRIRGGWVGSGGFSQILEGGPDAEIIHPQKRFYTGGANSVRGFAQSRLGPRVLFSEPPDLMDEVNAEIGGCVPESVADLSCMPGTGTVVDPRPTGGTRLLQANAELRFPLGRFFQGVVFTDVGQAWGPGDAVHLTELEFTPGLGIRFPTPVGPIRLDVAYRFRGEEALQIVTEEIRPFDSARDEPDTKIAIRTLDSDGVPQTVLIDWVATGRLVSLTNPFAYGANDQGFQVHISIGQAF